MEQQPAFMFDMVQQRHDRVRADVAAMRSRVSAHDPSAVRRQLGRALIALGQRLAGASIPAQPLPAGLAFTTAHR
jgi:hypothetical protein